MSKSVIIIPARLAATRLPNKPLIKINDKSLIMHVYEKASRCNIGDVFVATCDEEIANEVDKSGGKFIMTNSMHKTGTDRVYEASKILDLQNDDYVINVQGDEPMINPEDIKKLHNISKNNNLNFSTLAFNIINKNDYSNENIVKVLTKNKITETSFAIANNFKRKINLDIYNVYHHYGIYLYKFFLLEKLVNLKQTKNEESEKLEQLRALDNTIDINVILAKHFSVGIDTEEDLDNYRKLTKE